MRFPTGTALVTAMKTEDVWMAEDATPLVEALLAIIDAARAYLPPDGIARAAPGMHR